MGGQGPKVAEPGRDYPDSDLISEKNPDSPLETRPDPDPTPEINLDPT